MLQEIVEPAGRRKDESEVDNVEWSEAEARVILRDKYHVIRPIEKMDNGFYPMHAALHAGREEAVKLLLCVKASVSLPFDEGFCPIHTAARLDFVDMVKLLIL